MNKTKIDWADMTWNPVTGCLHGCKYCYARKIANRFCTNEHGKGDGILAPCDSNCRTCSEMDGLEFIGDSIRHSHNSKQVFPYGFLPTFYRSRLDEPEKIKKPKNIFVCSMADLFGQWVPDLWISKVFRACEAASQHRYLFLTKNGKRYEQLGLLPDNESFWYGTTRTGLNSSLECGASDHGHIFLSIEPLLAPIHKNTLDAIEMWDWVIIGAETGNRKGKVIPEKLWIDSITEQCQTNGVPIFMKESLRTLMGDDFRQEFPWVRRCRICGCTDDRACPGGCYWVEYDLCSSCDC